MITLDTLPPEIKKDLAEYGRTPVEVIDPSPGVWGGDPVPGLVTIVYECHCSYWAEQSGYNHTHHALYGPRDEKSLTGPYTIYAD